MPKFNVLCRVDAFIDYTAEVEAANEAEAARLANLQSDRYAWTKQGDQEFDARVYVTLDADGHKIESTEAGDF